LQLLKKLRVVFDKDMIPFHRTIGFRLLLVSFILLSLPLLVDSFIFVRQRYEHKVTDAKAYLVEIANFRELPLSRLHPLSHPLTDAIVYGLNLETSFPQQGTPELNEKLKSLAQVGELHGVFLVKATEGKYTVIASSIPQFIGKDYAEFFKVNNFQAPPSLKTGFASYIAFDEQTEHPYFVMSHAIYSPKEHKVVGIVVILDDITLAIQDLLKLDLHRFPVNFALMLPSSTVFASSDPTLHNHYFRPLKKGYSGFFQQENLPSAQPILTKNIEMPFFEFTWEGKEQIGYVKTFPQGHYAFLTYAAKGKIIQTPLADLFGIYSIYALILIVGGTLMTLLTMRMVKPIQNLSDVMQKMQKGDLGLRYQKDSFGFEINVLGDIFNEMVDAVLEQKQLAEEESIQREIFHRELRLGQEVQRKLLPQQMPQYPGVDVAETYIPAIEVGGDFYDVFVIQKEETAKLALAIADASGKGVQACFYSLSVRNMLRIYLDAYDDVAKAMEETNELLRKDTAESGMFVTVLTALYEHNSRYLSYYSCGHNPGYVKRADGTLEILKSEGVAMGVVPSRNATAHGLQLHLGDVIIFYTDGVTEAMNREDQFFGVERLERCICNWQGGRAAELVEEIIQSVKQFVNSAPQHDDITLLVMKIIK
jgi:phosphoserine phosphatase RsbU/P